MNSIEFQKVLDAFDIHSIIGSVIDNDGARREVYSWRGIDVSFSGPEYYPVCVKGCIPYEVAKIIYKKYPEYRDDIRINGVHDYGKVREKKDYPKDEMGNAYIESYLIKSVEGLVCLLSEIQYFYDVRTYTEESRKALYREQKEIIASVYRELIEEGNPNYSTEDFKKEHHISDDEYDEIRELVSQFDGTVNPYINSEVEVKDPREFIDKVKMQNYYGRFNIFQMEISANGGKAEYSRDYITCHEDEFLRYFLEYEIKPDYIMSVVHTISEEHDEIRLCGFKKADVHKDYLNEGEIDLSYNMRSGLVHNGACSEKDHPITEEERELFIAELNKALKVGGKLILNPMTKKKNNLVKKLS